MRALYVPARVIPFGLAEFAARVDQLDDSVRTELTDNAARPVSPLEATQVAVIGEHDWLTLGNIARRALNLPPTTHEPEDLSTDLVTVHLHRSRAHRLPHRR